MNEYFEQNRRPLLILISLLFILMIVLYVMIVHPLLADYAKKEQDIVSVNEEIERLKTKLVTLEAADEDVDIEQILLEKKIPLERNLDEYILALQRFETMTNSKIENIQFGYDQDLQVAEEEEKLEEFDEEIEDKEKADEDEIEEKLTIDASILNEKPEELEVMSVRFNAISPSLDDFLNLIKLIENEERLSIVTNLHFEQLTEAELTLESDVSDKISFEAELTTFYYDGSKG